MSSTDALRDEPAEGDDVAGGRRKSNPDFIDALARGLEVIRVFSSDTPEMTLTEVAGRTGLSPATARRCLLTLKELGYVGVNGRRFLLRSKVLSLGGAFLDSMHLRDVADAHLQDLAETFHEAASMAVLEDNDVVYIAHVPSRREARFRVRIGWRLPAYATSMGHVILAHLDPVTQAAFLKQAPFPRYTARTTTEAAELKTIFRSVVANGYATVHDQLEYGSIAIAVPVHDAKGHVFAAINCSSETSRVDEAELIATRLPKLRQAAREISDAVTRYPALMHSIGGAG
ncbi:MAG: IclR family transcriptional regulator C-terminal domain-containing protein [Bauldia sp.]